MFPKRFSTVGSMLAYAPPSFCTIDGDGGDAGGGAAVPQISDEASAISALEGLLGTPGASGDDDDRDDQESDASASDAGDEETRPTGDEEGQNEPQANQPAAIEPPASWSAEEKALFGKLPPEAQAVVARRESERDKLIVQRTQEIAEHRKAAEAERTAVQTERQQYLTGLQQLLHFTLPEAKQFEGVDWAKLAAEQPAEWARLSGARDALRQRVGAVQTEMQRVMQQAQAEQQQRSQTMLAEHRQKLVEKVPEFGDPEKAPKLSADLGAYLQQRYGFTPDEIGQVVDHRAVMMAVDAMRAHQAETARKAAEGKRQNAPPTVQRSGTPQGSDDTATRRIQAKGQQFRKTGSVRDAVSLLADIL